MFSATLRDFLSLLFSPAVSCLQHTIYIYFVNPYISLYQPDIWDYRGSLILFGFFLSFLGKFLVFLEIWVLGLKNLENSLTFLYGSPIRDFQWQ